MTITAEPNITDLDALLDDAIGVFRSAGVDEWPVWTAPDGGTILLVGRWRLGEGRVRAQWSSVAGVPIRYSPLATQLDRFAGPTVAELLPGVAPVHHCSDGRTQIAFAYSIPLNVPARIAREVDGQTSIRYLAATDLVDYRRRSRAAGLSA